MSGQLDSDSDPTQDDHTQALHPVPTQDLTQALFHEEPPPCAAAEADEEAVPTCTGALSLVLQTVLDDSAARGL